MALIERFEDIRAWQEARVLTNQFYQLTSVGEFARDNGLRDHIRRASVPALTNIKEDLTVNHQLN